MPSFNIICHTADPITDEQGDRMVTYLSAYSPVVDGDGTVTLTVEQGNQNLAIALAVSLVLMFDFVTVSQVEAMTTEEYDEVYGVVPTDF